MARVVDLPSRGTLLIATDLQGNVADWLAVERRFLELHAAREDAFLVVTGDLVHGPELDPDEWPAQLGSYYHGDSAEVLSRAERLQRQFPGQVVYLLGNHEHAHVGGPTVGKFFTDEAARLEELMGARRSSEVRAWLRTWPLVAVAPRARICMLHAAPHANISSRDDVERVELGSLAGLDAESVTSRSVLGAILWARSTTRERARAFLRALGPALTTAIYGHDVVREGLAVEDASRVCLSTSFGCHDGDKMVVEWDLSEPAVSAFDVARRGARRLWPDAPIVYSDPGVAR
ncbi:MAG: metallophosphoesterase [Polyangiaceae bacterium]|nr:metallophosphoesterase [Polyangiaceae bacterium]